MLRWIYSDPDADQIAAQYFVDAFVEFYSKSNLIDLAGLEGDKRDKVKLSAQAQLLDGLYKNLDTLDHKATCLLTYCGLVIAAVGFASTSFAGRAIYLPEASVLVLAAAVAALLSLSVIHVDWPSAASLQNRTVGDACCHYYILRKHRSAIYLWAWRIMVATTIAIGIGYIAHTALSWQAMASVPASTQLDVLSNSPAHPTTSNATGSEIGPVLPLSGR